MRLLRPLIKVGVSTCPPRKQSTPPIHRSSWALCYSTESKPKTKRRNSPAKPVKTAIAKSALPSAKTGKDGLPLKPLAPWSEQKPVPKYKPTIHSELEALVPTSDTGPVESTLSAIDEAAETKRAIAEGVIPDTPLSKEIFANWLRFPDCILLTRVGKFYESYFEPAIRLASVLNIKLATKTYKGVSEGTSRDFPFAGFPVPALDKYLKILVQDLGHTVVLVEEYDDDGSVAHLGKKVTAGPDAKERKVYRVVTPGTMVDEGWLDGNENRYLLAVAVDDTIYDNGNLKLSLAYTDPSTGEFFAKNTTLAQMEDELARIAPCEVVLNRSLRSDWLSSASVGPRDATPTGIPDLFRLFQVLGLHVSFANPHRLPLGWDDATHPLVDNSSKPESSEGVAVSLLRNHLHYALRESTPTLSSPDRQNDTDHMQIDAATLQALEIRHALRPGGLVAIGERQQSSPLSSRGTLLSVISKTITQSGHRLLIRTLTAPSTSLPLINSRLELVQSFVDREELRAELRDILREVEDVMRIIQRFKSQRGDGRDVWDVGKWIRHVQKVLGRIEAEIKYGRSSLPPGVAMSEGLERLEAFRDGFNSLSDLADIIEGAIDEAAVMRGLATEGEGSEEQEGIEAAGDAIVPDENESKGSGKGSKESRKDRDERAKQDREDKQWWILPTFSQELRHLHDELASIARQKDQMQADLTYQLQSPSLRLFKSTRYGYHVYLEKPDTTKALQFDFLEGIGGSAGRVGYFAYGPWTALGVRREIAMENLTIAQRRASRELRHIVLERAEEIKLNAGLVDEMDLTLSFAQNAAEMGWVRPELDDSAEFHVEDGRHPSIESSLLQSSRTFTPNSTHMTPTSHLHIITGPNQGGKSTLLRQTAVIAILAQSGSFVPAYQARLGIVDRMFSRVGARDDLWRDRSTFMLEMVETAAILKYATNKSFVIMDEIGRGTTLQAGISIAYATLDHILRHVGCRTLFATHYHELGRMLGYDDSFVSAVRPSSTPSSALQCPEAGSSTMKSGVAAAERDTNREKGRKGVSFWCTDVDEVDGAFSYSYRLRPGINHNSHAIKAARLAGMPETFLATAEKTLSRLQTTGRFDPPDHPSTDS